MRDIKQTFSCDSVLLTTLIGYMIGPGDKLDDRFSDTPTALRTIVGRVDDFLQINPSRPYLRNPSLPSENLADLWTGEKYENFRTVWHRTRQWVDDAYEELDRKASISKWRRVFGDEFAKSAVLNEGASVSRLALDAFRKFPSVIAMMTEGAIFDLVSAVRTLGAAAMPDDFRHQAHMRQPRWRVAQQPTFQVRVRATLYQSKGYGRLGDVQSLQPLSPGRWLNFEAVTTNNAPLPRHDFRVEWRITNTDVQAFKKQALRGGFEQSDPDQSRFEQLEYRGVHMAEAFVIRKRDETQVAQSEPFYVMIE